MTLGRYRRLSDHVSAALTFLECNLLLRSPLEIVHLRARPAADWHGTPAVSALYAHLHRVARDHDVPPRLITSLPAAPIGHLANLWMAGLTLPRWPSTEDGLTALAGALDEARQVFAKEIADAATPEEALATAVDIARSGYAVCAVDASRSSNYFLDGLAGRERPSGGPVLPVLCLGGRLGATAGYGSLDDTDRTAALVDAGYRVETVEIGVGFEATMFAAMERAWHGIQEHPTVLVLKMPRALSLPPALSTRLSHEADAPADRSPHNADVPESRLSREEATVELRNWMDRFAARELIDENGRPHRDITALCATNPLRG